MVIDCIKSAELALEIVTKEYTNHPSESLKKEKEKLEKDVNYYKECFSKMPEIENRLFYKIAYEGKGIMKAVNEVADENYYNDIKPTHPQWIYEKYYKKIKKYLKH